METRVQTWAVGQELPALHLPKITRLQLALFAGGSSDHNPMHVDIDVARSGGSDDVFAQGMLIMAMLGRAITSWAPQERLLDFSVRFTAMTLVGDELTCRGEVVRVEQGVAELNVSVTDQTGAQKLSGTAQIRV
jgi:acyl dehydratase